MKAMSHWTVVLTLAVILVTVVVMPNFVRAQPLTTLHSFLDRKRGAEPVAGLIQATNGDFYGTTAIGGENSNSSYGCSQGCGTVFKITPDGGLTLLYSFCSQTDCTDGLGPYAGLIQATNGDFYGTSLYGGQNSNSSYCPQGCGTVFKITPDGTMTRVYSFCSQTDCEDGAEPYAGLIQATDGNFYGTTQGGGMNEAGTVFKITPSGTLTTLYSFCHKTHCKDGATPGSRLLQATDGNFYGTTLNGGTQKSGTVFKISADGRLTTLYSFCSQANCEDGSETDGGLIQATDGNFYGTTASGGAHASGGTVFVITPSGTLNTLYSFCSQGPDCTDGRAPEAALVQATDGNFYGTTAGGGTNGAGTVYELTPSGSLRIL